MTDSDIRIAQDLLFFAYRDFTHAADVILEELGLGRAHHRALHFIGRHPGITVSELLSILRITKQSLARVLNELVERAYVAQAPGLDDRRQRLLSLTQNGVGLEQRLFERQRARLAEAFHTADPSPPGHPPPGPSALDAFRTIMLGVMDKSARAWVEQGARRPMTHAARAVAPAGTTSQGKGNLETASPGTASPGTERGTRQETGTTP